MKSVIFYDKKMTNLITSYNNENSAYEELSTEKCGVSVDVRNGKAGLSILLMRVL